MLYPYLLANESVQPYTDDEVANASIRARRFESTGQIMMRSGWRSDATYCLFTAGGWITEHRHYDENNFVIYKNGFLALDTGSRASQNDYNLEHYYAQTVAHNCVLIHKPNEPLPRHWGIRSSDLAGRYCDGGQTVRGVSRVLAFETDALYTYVAADATAAYPTKGAEVVRQFLHLTDDCFVIYDRVESTDAAYDKEWLLHTEEEPTIDGALMMTTVRNGGTLYCRTLLPAEAQLEKIGGSGQEFWSNGRNWEIDAAYLARQRAACQSAGSGPWFGQWRLSVRPASAATQDRFLHIINVSGNAASGAVASSVSSDEDGDCAEIDLPNVTVGGQTGRLKATVRFNRTGSVGGGIRYRLLDGQGAEILTGTRPFADTVEPQSGVFNR